MEKRIKRKSPSAKLPPHGDARPQAMQPVGPDITDLVNKMSQQLLFLEKKIDTLISQSLERPSEGKHFSRPYQRFDLSHRNYRGNQDNRHRERTFTQAICADCNKKCEVPFKPSAGRPVYCSECFSKRKGGGSFNGNRDNQPRERGFVQRPQFDKQHGRENRRFGKKTTPFLKQRKRRG